MRSNIPTVIKMKWMKFVAMFFCILMIGQIVLAIPPDEWEEGKEKEVFGHTFDEEYWTAPSLKFNSSDGKKIAEFSVSYVNYKNVQCFLAAFNKWENKEEGIVGTLPWQLFGMHYYTKNGKEAFLGAILAFLFVYNDTSGNGMPDTGEESFFVIPFGVGKVLGENDTSYVPETSVISAQKLDDGHYKFGISYKNLYARAVKANINSWKDLISWIIPIYVVRFSELTITYDIKIEDDKVTAETFYTIGQVTKLWILGKQAEREDLSENLGIAPVHYIASFTSIDYVPKMGGKEISTGITKPIDENITINVRGGEERIFEIGYRGNFSLIDEESGKVISEDQKAYNIILKAYSSYNIFVLWQASFSLDVLSTFAYALSEENQQKFDSPKDLRKRGGTRFTSTKFWYAVAFPSWKGYKVVHDPTYIGYVGEPLEKKKACGSIIIPMIAGILATVPSITYFRKLKK